MVYYMNPFNRKFFFILDIKHIRAFSHLEGPLTSISAALFTCSNFQPQNWFSNITFKVLQPNIMLSINCTPFCRTFPIKLWPWLGAPEKLIPDVPLRCYRVRLSNCSNYRPQHRPKVPLSWSHFGAGVKGYIWIMAPRKLSRSGQR